MTYIKPPASHECTWRSGPPPEVGWWPASGANEPTILRWWNGRHWSIATHSERSSDYAANNANSKIATLSINIRWTDRWWLKSRKETK